MTSAQQTRKETVIARLLAKASMNLRCCANSCKAGGGSGGGN